jgi:hypothetical protein
MTEPESTDREKPGRQSPALKPYQAPRLQIYGDLADITKAHANGSKNDGGVFINRKTTP